MWFLLLNWYFLKQYIWEQQAIDSAQEKLCDLADGLQLAHCASNVEVDVDAEVDFSQLRNFSKKGNLKILN